MAAHQIASYIDGTSARKLDEGCDRFSLVRGGRCSVASSSDDSYFAHDLKIMVDASGISELASDLDKGTARGALRPSVSWRASLGAASLTAVFAIVLLIL